MKYSRDDPYIRQIAYERILKPISKILRCFSKYSEYLDYLADLIDNFNPIGTTELNTGNLIVTNDVPDSIPGDCEKIYKI
jgi:hypothetical protein